MSSPSKLSWVAAIVAFLLAGLIAASLLVGQVFVVPLAVVPLMAGIGILRGRAWSAYGFALFEAAQLLVMPLLLLRSGNRGSSMLQGAVFTVVLAGLFFAAGRSLAKTGGERGRAWPWIAASALCTVPWLFLEAFVIPTGSMENTLLLGDRILIQLFPKPTPGRGQILVFRYPVDRKQTFIKRVIGMPGDRIHLSKKAVYRNGSALSEPYVVYRFPANSYRDDFPTGAAHFPLERAAQEMLAKHVVNGEVVVPDGKFFVLGDNRDNSLDSRYWGFLDSADILGKPVMIYGSEEPTNVETSGRKHLGLYRVRWGRLFKVL